MKLMRNRSRPVECALAHWVGSALCVGHAIVPDNNINGISGEADGEAFTGEPHRLGDPALNAIQAAYVRKVVDTVNDFDNVFCEVINEGGHRDWDWWIMKTARDCERSKPKQHPIGLTGHGPEGIKDMLASTADWISPGANDGYGENPPAWTGQKVSLLDTDRVSQLLHAARAAGDAGPLRRLPVAADKLSSRHRNARRPNGVLA